MRRLGIDLQPVRHQHWVDILFKQVRGLQPYTLTPWPKAVPFKTRRAVIRAWRLAVA
jgi:hypothetical protein